MAADVRVDVDAKVKDKEIGDADIFLTIKLTNESKNPIWVDSLDGEWINLEFEIWSSGRGIKLRSKNDAEWRRESAFILWESEKINSGETKNLTLQLKDLVSPHPENDELTASIIQEIRFLREGMGSVNIEYKNKIEEKSKLARKPFKIMNKRKGE